MNMFRLSMICTVAAGLAACTSGVPDATRNLPINEATGRTLAVSQSSAGTGDQSAGYSIVEPRYDVVAVNVDVPKTLKVSEANMYYPVADIVWRGEPRGDRHAQVKAIFQEAFAAGTKDLVQGRQVVVDLQVLRFHCLTEKARYTVGGVHSVKFNLTVRDAATGQVIDGPRTVVADIKASGGAIAVEEEAQGVTQRLVISEHLTSVAMRELTRPLAVPAARAVAPSSRSGFDPTAVSR